MSVDETHAGLETADLSIEDPLERAISSVKKDSRPETAPRTVNSASVEITQDITGNSTCTGEYSDFRKYFTDKIEKLEKILEKHNIEPKPQSIGSLEHVKKRRGENDVTIIGMIYEMWESRNGHQMVELDDTSGKIKVVFTDNEIKDFCQKNIIRDEVVAVTGQLSDDGSIIFGDSIELPEIPPTNRKNTADIDAEVALISDTHFGSQEFAAKKWNLFVDWVHRRESLKYILISGDIVEGIGVYPNQKEELLVGSIEDQYKIAAEAFKEIPDSVEIITSVGNHDSVRLAEPQPTLPDKFTKEFPDNVTVVGNPAMVNIEGVKFLLYHGVSLNTLIEKLHGLDIHEPTQAMIPLLKKRHLAPVWGEGIRIAPEHEDYLSIVDIPDVLHSGHLHTYGIDEYRDVSVVNTGCWQERTDYQRSKNVFPDVGHAPVYDLQEGEISEFSF